MLACAVDIVLISDAAESNNAACFNLHYNHNCGFDASTWLNSSGSLLTQFFSMRPNLTSKRPELNFECEVHVALVLCIHSFNFRSFGPTSSYVGRSVLCSDWEIRQKEWQNWQKACTWWSVMNRRSSALWYTVLHVNKQKSSKQLTECY